MATAIPSSLISDIRGSIGTQTWSRNRGGIYVKLRKAPINPNTVPQQTARQRVRSATIAWRNLTQAQRDKYDLIAKQHTSIDRLGNPSSISGYNLYVRHYTILSLVGAPSPTTILEPIYSPGVFINSIIANSSKIEFQPAYQQALPNVGAFFYASAPRPATRKAINPSTLRYLGVTASSSSPPPVNFTTQWQALFGLLSTHVGKITTFGVRALATPSAQLGHLMCFNVTIQ